MVGMAVQPDRQGAAALGLGLGRLVLHEMEAGQGGGRLGDEFTLVSQVVQAF